MFPLRDTKAINVFPLITHALIAVNIFVFLIELTLPDPEAFIYQYSLVPASIDFSVYSSLAVFITSQFLHAGFFHIISNLWFLHIFGDNVEEKFGHLLYLVVYLFSGVVGGFIQYLFVQDSVIPMLGASGAVAGVLGAYFVFYPHHKIETLIPFGLFMTRVNIPAQLMLFYWFATQLFSGVGSIAVAQLGGVAFWAHVGGFVTGYIVARLLNKNEIQVEEGEVLGF